MKTSPGEIHETLLQRAESRLAQGERMVATLAVDLDGSLRFRAGLLVLTNLRLLHVETAEFREWRLAELTDLILEEMGPTVALHLRQG
ncbi:MAG: hypothetical protein JNG86_04800, partial [Verrucomicrobiaceae bacterium]|nr:hypothetical protein [Verrucomicrobiaceae bacterium]